MLALERADHSYDFSSFAMRGCFCQVRARTFGHSAGSTQAFSQLRQGSCSSGSFSRDTLLGVSVVRNGGRFRHRTPSRYTHPSYENLFDYTVATRLLFPGYLLSP